MCDQSLHIRLISGRNHIKLIVHRRQRIVNIRNSNFGGLAGIHIFEMRTYKRQIIGYRVFKFFLGDRIVCQRVENGALTFFYCCDILTHNANRCIGRQYIERIVDRNYIFPHFVDIQARNGIGQNI